MARVHIVITTYKRAGMLRNLLSQIEDSSKGHELSIAVYDDCTPIAKDFSVPESIESKTNILTFNRNMGKEGFWRIINRSFYDIQKMKPFDYYIYLQDDYKLNENFINDCISKYNGIEDPRKICMSYRLDKSLKGKPNWTGVTPKPVRFRKNTYFLTNWVELSFICQLRFFRALKFRIMKINKHKEGLSSGVGRQMSSRLFKYRYKMYHVTSSLVEHLGSHDSVMHPNHRKKQPLISI